MFLTRLPVPRSTDHRPEYLQQAPKYFPWVGLLVGGFSVAAYLVSRLLFPLDIALVASMLTGILVTGAFHEDGFADVCDGFGGGWTKEKILMIMKDSRLGTFGVVGLISILGLKFLMLLSLSRSLSDFRLFSLLLLAHAGSRLCAVFVMQVFPYVEDVQGSKSREATGRRMGAAGWCISVSALLPALAGLPPLYWTALLPAILIAYCVARYFSKWIGGYTGDCLGAIQQITEIIFYAWGIIVWKYT